MATLMSNVAGWVISANPDGGYCLIQQFGNFPRADQNVDEPGNTFEESVQRGYTFTGQFVCQGYALSVGQQVLFDIAEGSPLNFATNVRVP